jgi:hypothetical protein
MSMTARRSLWGAFALGGLLTLAHAQAISSPEDVLSVEKVMVDPAGHTALITVRNLTGKTITAFSLSVKATYIDGTSEERSGQMWDLILVVGIERATGESTRTNETLYAGDSRQVSVSTLMSHSERALQSFAARAIMAAFDDGTVIGDAGAIDAVRLFREGTAADLTEVLTRVGRLRGTAEELGELDKDINDVASSGTLRERPTIQRNLNNIRDAIAGGHGDMVPVLLNILRTQQRLLTTQARLHQIATREGQHE